MEFLITGYRFTSAPLIVNDVSADDAALDDAKPMHALSPVIVTEEASVEDTE